MDYGYDGVNTRGGPATQFRNDADQNRQGIIRQAMVNFNLGMDPSRGQSILQTAGKKGTPVVNIPTTLDEFNAVNGELFYIKNPIFNSSTRGNQQGHNLKAPPGTTSFSGITEESVRHWKLMGVVVNGFTHSSNQILSGFTGQISGSTWLINNGPKVMFPGTLIRALRVPADKQERQKFNAMRFVPHGIPAGKQTPIVVPASPSDTIETFRQSIRGILSTRDKVTPSLLDSGTLRNSFSYTGLSSTLPAELQAGLLHLDSTKMTTINTIIVMILYGILKPDDSLLKDITITKSNYSDFIDTLEKFDLNTISQYSPVSVPGKFVRYDTTLKPNEISERKKSLYNFISIVAGAIGMLPQLKMAPKFTRELFSLCYKGVLPEGPSVVNLLTNTPEIANMENSVLSVLKKFEANAANNSLNSYLFMKQLSDEDIVGICLNTAGRGETIYVQT